MQNPPFQTLHFLHQFLHPFSLTSIMALQIGNRIATRLLRNQRSLIGNPNSSTLLSTPNRTPHTSIRAALFPGHGVGSEIAESVKKPSKIFFRTEVPTMNNDFRNSGTELFRMGMVSSTLLTRCITTTAQSADLESQHYSASVPEEAPRIKFKRLDKTARHIMQILDKEAVEEVKEKREIARDIVNIKPGYIIQLKVEVPENKRRVSTLKGVVIARRNAGLNSTFRIRRLVAGVGVENVYPLYSPNIKELKILEKKKVRRAKLYYLRDKMNALKKQTTR